MNKNLAKIIAVSTLAVGAFVHNTQEVSATVDSVVRIEGANRFETSALISKEGFEKADVVLIANAREFADALAGVPLAYQKDAPILLAQGNRLNQVIVEEINRLGAKQAIILGGEVAVNRELENHIKSLGLSTSRLAGQNRFETSELIADELLQSQSSNNAVVVDGFEFADAMSIAPFAAQEGMPIYLSRTNSLSTKDSLKDFDQTYIIGGENAISKQVESELNNPIRLAGANRYETNIEVLEYFDIDSNNLFVATGLDFADALTGSVLSAKRDSAIALVRSGISESLYSFLNNSTFEYYSLLGGETAISTNAFDSFKLYHSKSVESAVETVIENIIQYELIEVENSELPIGESRIVQEGQDGYDEVTYNITYVNGKEIERVEVDRRVNDKQNQITEIGTKFIGVEAIVIKNSVQELFVEDEYTFNVDVFPIDATDKTLVWASSDNSIAEVDQNGKLIAKSAGWIDVTVADNSSNILETISIEILNPSIVSYDSMVYTISQFDNFSLPSKVTAHFDNNTSKELFVNWKVNDIDTHQTGSFVFSGILEGYDYPVELVLNIDEFIPNIYTNAYSQVTINNMSQALAFQIKNYGDVEVNILKIELYEEGKYFTTYSASDLQDSGVSTTILPGDNWGISASFRFGFFLNNSYVKYYLEIHGEEFVYNHNL